MMKKNKPRLLYFVEAMGGGVFTYMVDLANGLIDRYDVYIAYAVRKQTPKDYRDYFDKRIHLIEVKNFSRSLSLTSNFKAFFEMKQIAKEVQPDVIHLHSSMAGVLGRFAFNGKKIPLFYTPHGYSFLMQNFGSKKRLAFKLIEEICAKRTCTTISCSAGENEETLKMTKQAVEIDNGINVNELQKLINETEPSNFKHYDVFTLGRITAQKNPKQFNEIAESMPNLNFLWIGDGELRSELTASNITVTGWLTRREALKYSLGSDTFVLTSLWEGLPMSLLEAMYMDKLSIVSDVIGNHDVINNGVNGYVCQDTDSFVKAIGEGITNIEKRNKLIDTAKNEVIEHYNTVVVANKYKSLYSRYIKEK